MFLLHKHLRKLSHTNTSSQGTAIPNARHYNPWLLKFHSHKATFHTSAETSPQKPIFKIQIDLNASLDRNLTLKSPRIFHDLESRDSAESNHVQYTTSQGLFCVFGAQFEKTLQNQSLLRNFYISWVARHAVISLGTENAAQAPLSGHQICPVLLSPIIVW